MLRSAGKLVGGAAGVAASGPAVSAQCRSQQPRVLAPGPLQEDIHSRSDGGLKSHHANALGEEWLVTDLKHAMMGEDQVIFGEEEINETMQSVFAFTSGSRSGAKQAALQVSEVGEDDSEEELARLEESNLHMQAAEMQLAAPAGIHDDFNRMLSKLLHNEEVQNACVRALRDDKTFQGILDSPDTSPISVPIHRLLPSDGTQLDVEDMESREGGPNNFVDLIHNLAAGIKHMGDVIIQKAIGARNLIGKFLIELGCNLHEKLGQPFGSTPVEECNEESNNKAEIVGNALITVACAILTLVLLRRVHRIQFV